MQYCIEIAFTNTSRAIPRRCGRFSLDIYNLAK